MTHLLKCGSSVDAPTWFKPLSDLIILTLPLRPTNLLKLIMNESVLREYTTSICMTLLERQVHRAQYLLTSFWLSPTRNDTNKSNPRYVNGGSSLILSLGKSAIFCCWSLPLNCLHQTLQDGTSDQKVKSCHQRTLFGSLQCLNQHELLAHDTNSAILQDFGSNIGCCISFARAELWILPQTLTIPSSSMHGPTFTMLLHGFKHFPFRKEINSSPTCLLWADLIIFFSAIFISSKSNSVLQGCFVWNNSLAYLLPLMQLSSFFLKHNTRPMILFHRPTGNSLF